MREYLSIQFSGDRVLCSGRCGVTGKPWNVEVTAAQHKAWCEGTLAQKAFPELTPAERELLISGTSPEGWEILFGGPED